MKIIQKTKNKTVMKSNRGNIYEFTYIYPDKNPPNALEDIANCLAYLGVFDGIKKE